MPLKDLMYSLLFHNPHILHLTLLLVHYPTLRVIPNLHLHQQYLIYRRRQLLEHPKLRHIHTQKVEFLRSTLIRRLLAYLGQSEHFLFIVIVDELYEVSAGFQPGGEESQLLFSKVDA